KNVKRVIPGLVTRTGNLVIVVAVDVADMWHMLEERGGAVPDDLKVAIKRPRPGALHQRHDCRLLQAGQPNGGQAPDGQSGRGGGSSITWSLCSRATASWTRCRGRGRCHD